MHDSNLPLHEVKVGYKAPVLVQAATPETAALLAYATGKGMPHGDDFKAHVNVYDENGSVVHTTSVHDWVEKCKAFLAELHSSCCTLAEDKGLKPDTPDWVKFITELKLSAFADLGSVA